MNDTGIILQQFDRHRYISHDPNHYWHMVFIYEVEGVEGSITPLSDIYRLNVMYKRGIAFFEGWK